MNAPRLTNIEAEKAVLGAMLLTADALGTGLERLDASDFFVPHHQELFAAISEIERRGDVVDPVSVAGRLTDIGKPTSYGALLGFSTGSPAATSMDTYVRAIVERSQARQLSSQANETLMHLDQGVVDATGAANQLAETAYTVELGGEAEKTLVYRDLSAKHFDDLVMDLVSPTHITGHRTGFTDLDQLMGGLKAGTLTVVGARPSMGKSAFGLAIAHYVAAECNEPTLLASLEMSHMELQNRLLASRAKVDMRRRPITKADLVKLSNADAELQDIPLTIDATAALTLGDLRSKAKRVKRRNNGKLTMIIVDYIQLMRGPKSEARHLEVGELSRGLKAIAGDLDCAVVALAQLSRQLESRPDKRPQLSDLRESGSIEQDADNVIFIYRDEVYDPTTVERGTAELLLKKARNGPTGTVKVAWLPQYPAFGNLRRNDQSETPLPIENSLV